MVSFVMIMESEMALCFGTFGQCFIGIQIFVEFLVEYSISDFFECSVGVYLLVIQTFFILFLVDYI